MSWLYDAAALAALAMVGIGTAIGYGYAHGLIVTGCLLLAISLISARR